MQRSLSFLHTDQAEQDKASKDHQIRNLNDEISHQDELINKLNKEKKALQETGQKTGEDLQATEDKVNHLSKVKAKLEQTLDELEDTLEREKKARADLDKNKRKVESDLKLAQEAVADLEKGKKDLESGLGKKEKEIASLNSKLEEEQALLARTQKQIKESQVRHGSEFCRFRKPRSAVKADVEAVITTTMLFHDSYN